MRIVFLDSDSLGGVDLSPISRLATGGFSLYGMTSGEEQTIERAKGHKVLICNKVPITRRVLSELKQSGLELVVLTATGMNNVDLDAAKELAIEVRNAVGYSTHSVAEATIGSALALLRHNSYYDRYVKGGEYTKSGKIFCFDRRIGELHGSRWGIIGLGAIGREVARLATAFGCEVCYFSTSGTAGNGERKEDYASFDTLDELLGWSDVLSIHAPLSGATKNLISEREFSAMQPHAIIINMARGGIVDESALVAALNSGTIAAASLDVFANEPLMAGDAVLHNISDSDKLLLAPHNGWASTNAINQLVLCTAENIKQFKQS
ncbi:MAG: NAD(P)-dependent oxidoreductase [Rikenellaceae bacterium]